MRKKMNKKNHLSSDFYTDPSVVSASQWLAYIKKRDLKIPSRAIMCFSRFAVHFFRKKHLKDHTNRLYLFDLTIDIYQGKKSPIGIVSPVGCGGPVAVMGFEILQTLGVKELWSLGAMGSLTKSLQIGDRVWCAKALRDEGCSNHYKKPSLFVKAHPLQTNQLSSFNLKPVNCWTTDAPFRETQKKIFKFTNQGVQCVDMESASLLSAGEYYQLPVYCLGVISDHLSPHAWTPQFLCPSVKKSFYELLHQIHHC